MKLYITNVMHKSTGHMDHGVTIFSTPKEAIMEHLKMDQMIYKHEDKPFILLEAIHETDSGDLEATYQVADDKRVIWATEVALSPLVSAPLAREVSISVRKAIKEAL